MNLQIEEADGGITVVRLSGRLDIAGADAIGLRFTSATASAAQPTVVDLAGVEFIASMGLRLLISSARALGAKGRRMALFGAQPLVQAVFEDAALDQLMPVCATEAEAIAAVTG
jgi:anti-anti-sigma factor